MAVFVRLDDEIHGPDRGRWFLEASFGPYMRSAAAPFASLTEVELWCRAQLALG
ncbi:MAG TPA: hypothetical protein VGU45_16650 [Microvirga sp.]|jgi:hypothetical protein|nr:hypothetical protein [Microvirga sp.]